VAGKGKDHPFFSSFDAEIDYNNKQPAEAEQKLIDRDSVFYKKTIFRSFFHLSKQECDEMTIQEFIDYDTMLIPVLKLIHAPYQKHN